MHEVVRVASVHNGRPHLKVLHVGHHVGHLIDGAGAEQQDRRNAVGVVMPELPCLQQLWASNHQAKKALIFTRRRKDERRWSRALGRIRGHFDGTKRS